VQKRNNLTSQGGNVAKKSRPGSTKQKALGLASTGIPELDTVINQELALFNKTNNFVALWSVFAKCAEHKVRMPYEVEAKLGEIAIKLVKLATDQTKGAREEVADYVLGTKNSSGGFSPFEKYNEAKARRRIVDRVFELLTTQKRSQSEVYEIIASENRLKPETVKRYFEQDDCAAGSFGYRTLKMPSGDV
jgi:hypothetical protein